MSEHDAERLRGLLHDSVPEAGDDPSRAVRARDRAHRMRRRHRTTYAGIVVAVLVAVGVPTGLGFSSGPGHGPGPTSTAPGACPVTRPMTLDQVPTTLRRLGSGYGWYGADDLWVDLPQSPLAGRADVLPSGPRKFASFTLDARGQMTNEKGPPTLTARRLDGSGSIRTAQLKMDNYGHTTSANGNSVNFWPTGIALPSRGCWQLTEKLGDTTIKFVVRVGDASEAICQPDGCGFAAIRRELRTPLRVPSPGPGGKCPVSTSRRFDGGAGFSGPFRGLGSGPVYLAPVGARHPARLQLQSAKQRPGWLWTKPIWVFDPTYAGPVLLRGERLDGPGRVEFDRYIGSAARTTGRDTAGHHIDVLYPRSGLHPTGSRGLESFPGGIYVHRPGCYAVQVDGRGFTEHIVFEVVDPGSPR